jgi:hypothetical protein
MSCALSFFQREWGSVSVGYAFGNALAMFFFLSMSIGRPMCIEESF